ncbi:MAG: TusE/DsrC/DsvC family sulfur relay protein [Wenzhouxiangella sp.]|jgi:tRNA 2-thiouridine synthesizing protein E|nr:TusE/DsrC/DsvC family sulfur relay protein [Wenzhouxiangella sp.]
MDEIEACGVLDGDGASVALDEDGHLRDPERWTRDVARALAQRDGVVLGDDHWWMIDFVRAHHDRYGSPPLMRMVVKALRAAREDPGISSRDVYRLFPEHPVRQACRYGGLAKPDWCI